MQDYNVQHYENVSTKYSSFLMCNTVLFFSSVVFWEMLKKKSKTVASVWYWAIQLVSDFPFEYLFFVNGLYLHTFFPFKL